MPSHVQRSLSSTPRLSGGHREKKPAVPESPDDCFGRMRCPPGIPPVPAVEALRDKSSATRWFSARFRIRSEVQMRLAATELPTRCGSDSAQLPPGPVRDVACGFDKLERARQS